MNQKGMLGKKYLVKILKTEKITHDVKKFKVEKPQNYSFTPGQATEVAINKKGFKDKFRPFTFTSLNENTYLEFIIKAYPVEEYPKHTGVTEQIHNLEVGDQFLIKDPVGTIKYKGEGVFLAGGVGITPFIAIFKDLKKKNKLKGNTLIFSNKKEEDIILRDILEQWFNDKNLVFTLTKENTEDFDFGRIDKNLLQKHLKDFTSYFYICGPSGFENDITEALLELGAKEERIIVEEW
jgi:ferredoxin-NADP reductase